MEIRWCFNPEEATLHGFDLQKAFAKIANAFQGEPHLLSVTAEELEASFAAGLSVIGFSPDARAVCHTRLVQLADGWYELGSTFVCLTYRGRNINHEMYRVFLPRHAEKDILATTTNPVSRRVGQDLGFVELRRRQLPNDVWQSSCTCPASKIGSSGPANCPLAFGESTQTEGLCYFRVTPETADRHNLR